MNRHDIDVDHRSAARKGVRQGLSEILVPARRPIPLHERVFNIECDIEFLQELVSRCEIEAKKIIKLRVQRIVDDCMNQFAIAFSRALDSCDKFNDMTQESVIDRGPVAIELIQGGSVTHPIMSGC